MKKVKQIYVPGDTLCTIEGMKKAKKVLKEYVEGMFTIFYAQRKDNNNE